MFPISPALARYVVGGTVSTRTSNISSGTHTNGGSAPHIPPPAPITPPLPPTPPPSPAFN